MTIELSSMEDNAKSASNLLKALSNESRLMIMCLLSQGEMSVSEINEHVDISQSALSQHLAKLRNDDLVSTRRESQVIYYSLKGGAASEIIKTLHNIYCDN